MLTKPRPRKVDQIIVGEEANDGYWLGRLAMTLAIYSHRLPDDARKTVEEFIASPSCHGKDHLLLRLNDEVER